MINIFLMFVGFFATVSVRGNGIWLVAGWWLLFCWYLVSKEKEISA